MHISLPACVVSPLLHKHLCLPACVGFPLLHIHNVKANMYVSLCWVALLSPHCCVVSLEPIGWRCKYVGGFSCVGFPHSLCCYYWCKYVGDETKSRLITCLCFRSQTMRKLLTKAYPHFQTIRKLQTDGYPRPMVTNEEEIFF